MTEIVRVLRILEYTGPREDVELLVSSSIRGQVRYRELTIRAATIGTYPEILESPPAPDPVQGRMLAALIEADQALRLTYTGPNQANVHQALERVQAAIKEAGGSL